MSTFQVILLWIVIIGVGLAAMYYWGSKLQKRYAEQQDLINQYKQPIQIFVIDKKKDKLENLKLPKQVKEQIPKNYKRRKMPVVIAKIGPQIQTLMCDENVYNSIPVKKQVKVELAGVFIVDVISGKLPEPEKVGFRQKMANKLQKEMDKEISTQKEDTPKKSKKKKKSDATETNE
ncbi:MAG: hypothetical protein ATN36_01240 [Epulopiscium sp. Nele67-Bin005]|nr:MAG: hypothetical protein ATN36_01240 [Epulopiscium sp. Nele67-Bin005]